MVRTVSLTGLADGLNSCWKPRAAELRVSTSANVVTSFIQPSRANHDRVVREPVARLKTAHHTGLIRGASPLGLPYTRSRAPLRRRAPFAWLARHARSHPGTSVRFMRPLLAIPGAFHSFLKATSGSTAIARRAGT